MNNEVRIEDFDKIKTYKDLIFASTSNSKETELAVFNQENKLLAYEKLKDPNAYWWTGNEEFETWFKNPKIQIVYYRLDPFVISRIAVYSVEENSYILPFGKYKERIFGDICIFQGFDTLVVINNMGEVLDQLTFPGGYIGPNSLPQICVFCEKYQCLTIKYNDLFGVYSWKEKKLIVPCEFNKLQLNDVGIVVTKGKGSSRQMGIYSYEGNIMLPIKSNQYIYTFEEDYNDDLIEISSNGYSGMYTHNLSTVLPRKYYTLSVWHPMRLRFPFVNDGNFFIKTQTFSYHKGLYSVLLKKFIVPSKYEKLILGKEIIAIKRILEPNVSRAYFETIYDTYYEHNGWAIEEVEDSYEKFHQATGSYKAYADIYTYEGTLLKKDIIISVNMFKN